MNIQQLLEHHGILRNPFAEEDAQVDPVFKDHCIDSTYHPVWDKVYGDPRDPSTSIVFGPKGAGKTAMRLQIQRKAEQFNRDHPARRVFVIRYDDFNPFLGQFQQRLSARRRRSPDRTLASWQLWDHMDAILSLAVTKLVNQILRTDSDNDPANEITAEDVARINRAEARDLLLLALVYDQSTQGVISDRWENLRKTLRFNTWWLYWDLGLAWVWGIFATVIAVLLVNKEQIELITAVWALPLAIVFGALPYLWRWMKAQWLAIGIRRKMRIGNRETSTLRKLLLRIPSRELASQPLPRHSRSDDRYAMLAKLQAAIRTLRFDGLLVLVDRMDEPELIEGHVDRMRMLVWPMLDNKLLKHPGLGLKMMLPRELYREVERESRSFHERARLDKQNVIADFAWTGQALYDVVAARMRACAAEGKTPKPEDLFDASVPRARLLAVFESLRVPRHLFRCLYRMLVEHCNQYTDSDAQFRLRGDTVEKTLALYLRDMDMGA